MKRALIIPLLLFCSIALFAADVVIESFTANSDNNNITLEWRTGEEKNLRKFEVERRMSNDNEFKVIGTVSAEGSLTTYRFVDENAFFKGEGDVISGTTYFYRLKMVGYNNQVQFSSTTHVTHTVSSVRRTWGMIKAMFRY